MTVPAESMKSVTSSKEPGKDAEKKRGPQLLTRTLGTSCNKVTS